ncbi:enoyl-CoA hydratase/isomerase family protein (plasmid) [Streptomyces sp. NBC_01176]|nr:enoyl-CoA hydratase/isomerase family protein [Streptomyces sp. NBC_01176]
MDFRSVLELRDLLEEFGRDTERVRVVMLAGGLDGKFIDHAELSDLARAGAGQASQEELGSWWRALSLLETIPQPTIAAIDGLASAGGNETALACTLRVASTHARFQQPGSPLASSPAGEAACDCPG